MKQRLLVMNGQRLIQSEQEGEWVTDKVAKAGAIKPGIYNIHLSAQADKAKTQDGVIVHADSEFIYQQVGKNFIKHDRLDFDKVPDIGSNVTIAYSDSRAMVSAASIKLGRRIS